MDAFTHGFGDRIEGVLSSFDHLAISGTLPEIGHAQGMARELRRRGLRLWDFHAFAQEQADRIRSGVEAMASSQGLEVEYLAKGKSYGETAIQGGGPHSAEKTVLLRASSTIEPCKSYRPWRAKPAGPAELKPRDASGIHYRLQLVEPELGLCQLRIPVLAPFPLRLELRGHRLLARRLDRQGIGYTLTDEGFQWIEDLGRARRLAAEFSPEVFHRCLDTLSHQYFPLEGDFSSGRRWGVARVGLATEVFFRDPGDLAPAYPRLVETASQAVRTEDVARFVGRPAAAPGAGQMAVEMGHRDLGSVLAFRRGPVTIRISHRSGRILRIETLTDDVTHLRDRRAVLNPDGTRQVKVAAVRRSIYSLPAIRRLLEASNARVLEFLTQLPALEGTALSPRR